jgi:methyltransferase (TIGR00027 family)
LDRLGEELEQQFEVGVALPGTLGVKAAGDLAEREAEDGGAQQSLHLVGAFLGDAGIRERETDRVACLTGRGGGRRTLKQKRKHARMAAGGRTQIIRERSETFRPGKIRGGLHGFGEEQLHEPVEQVGLARNVPVKRHRRYAEALGKDGHGQRVKSAFVGKRESFREDTRAIDSSRPTHKRKYMTYTYLSVTANAQSQLARRPSRTAQLMAVQRGLESARSARTSLFEDPLAGRFVSPAWRFALRGARFVVVRRAIETIYDLVGGPGPRASAIARTKLIDDLICEASPSIDQLVILGAGYDTRAHRLDCLLDRAVYEIDHPNTQAHKRAVLARAKLSAATAPRYVALDFEHDDLTAALIASGYQPARRSMFLWEGVTQYLSSEAIDKTLSAIRHATRQGDTLVFTYVDDAVLRGEHDRFPEAARWLHGTANRGEPWIFGVSPAGLHDYLRTRGFCLVSDLSTREAGERYFTPLRRYDRGSDLYHVATATSR